MDRRRHDYGEVKLTTVILLIRLSLAEERGETASSAGAAFIEGSFGPMYD